MDNCIFCKIIKGEIPAYKIYENDKVFAFLDIANDVYGHTLVVPKKHFRNVLDTEKVYLNAVIDAVQTISKHYVENMGFDSVNLLNINELVDHFHIHIIPRKNGDNVKLLNDLKSQDFDLEEMWNKLKLN